MKKLNLIYITKNAEKIWHQIRWKDGYVYCPYCNSINIYHCEHGYKCKDCTKRFTDKTNTLLHGSKLPIQIWLIAIFLIHLNKGISSIKLSTQLGINQKSAWLLLTKLRYAMNDDIKLDGNICVDECYLGGSFKNKHYIDKVNILRRYGVLKQDEWKYNTKQLFKANSRYKQPVFGLNDGKRIRLVATPNPITTDYIKQIFSNSVNITDDTLTISDESKLYDNWMTNIEINNHSKKRYYTKSGFTSNPIETTFSWLKRTIKFNFVHFDKKYTQLYLNEYMWRYNRKEMNDDELLIELIKLILHENVTYNQIKNYNQFGYVKNIKPPKKIENIDEYKSILNNGLISSINVNGVTYN